MRELRQRTDGLRDEPAVAPPSDEDFGSSLLRKETRPAIAAHLGIDARRWSVGEVVPGGWSAEKRRSGSGRSSTAPGTRPPD